MPEKRDLSTRVQDLIDHFQTIPADCLSLIVKKKVSAEEIAGVELASRGLNHDAKWIGFKKGE
ncbi:hypothetical protein ES703_24191 [subsurface metagenome]